MSVGLSDFVDLPCSPELISAGIAFTIRSQVRLFKTRSRVSIAHLRRLCADAIATVALRRWFASEMVPHGLSPVAPLTDPHVQQITLGGRQLHLVNHLISNRSYIRKLARNPQLLLQTEIPATLAHPATERLSPGDLLAYSFLLGTICYGHSEIRRRTDGEERTSLLAITPRRTWRQQRPWQSLGKLIVTNLDDESHDLELLGISVDRSATIDRVTIPANQSVEITKTWHNLLHLHTMRIPKASLQIRCPARRSEWLVTRSSWSNLWFYEPKLLLVGWLTKRELERVAKPRSRAKQAIRVRRLAAADSIVQVNDLRPINKLLQIARHI
jgi:hypothetical protein